MNKFIAYLYSFLDFNRYPGRYDARQRHTITTMFLLSGLYCVIALFFLLFFGLQSLALGREGYAFVLLGFAALTVGGYWLVWYLGYYPWISHMVIGLYGFLCLWLFNNGGEQGTAPMWYLLFPVLALFLQGHVFGMVSIGVLMGLTYLMANTDFGLDTYAYSDAFMQRLVAVYIAITALTYLFAYFRYQNETQLAKINEQLETMSNTDKLSGLLNRRGMEERLNHMMQTHARFQTPFSVIMMDIDGFKRINDEYGHLFGDYVIQAIAETCTRSLRQIDHVSRWGGDEFLLLMPGTGAEGAEVFAHRLREAINTSPFSLEGNSIQVTASFGICEHKGAKVIEKTISKADDFLYHAKQRGGNCVIAKKPIAE